MSAHSTRFAVLLAVLLTGCANAGGLEPINPMFERWCDQHPCGWDVEGEVKKVGTWHPDDFAIELVSHDASLSQLRSELTGLATCFEFSLMAHITAGARAYLELDFLDDGEVEFSERIPKSDWEVRTFTIASPGWYEGVRFIVRKEGGGGRVVVAELSVDLAHKGCSETPLPLRNRPAGASCVEADECASGSCSKLALSTGGTCD